MEVTIGSNLSFSKHVMYIFATANPELHALSRVSENITLRKQGSTNCAHGDERARNVHVKRLSRARNYVHVNQSKRL